MRSRMIDGESGGQAVLETSMRGVCESAGYTLAVPPSIMGPPGHPIMLKRGSFGKEKPFSENKRFLQPSKTGQKGE